MSDIELSIYAVAIGVPWWLWTLVYARNCASPLIADMRRLVAGLAATGSDSGRSSSPSSG